MLSKAILGGGCFWCLDAGMRNLKGVEKIQPAYAGGSEQNPNYKQVCSGKSGHAEVVVIDFDATILGYADLLRSFFSIHDPTQLNRQGNDIGPQYRSVIMPSNEEQKEVTKKVMDEMSDYFEKPIVTTIEQATNLTIAEEYHHDYYNKNPHAGYCSFVIAPKLAKFRQKMSHLIE